MFRFSIAVTLTVVLAAHTSSADESVDFDRDVLPILNEHCIDCHGPELSESQLRLDSIQAALRGGDSGEKSVVPGHSEKSYLIELVTTSDSKRRMPQDADPLSEKQVNILRRWVDDAAQWKTAEAQLKQQTINHWSFQPIVRPEIPDVKSQDDNAGPLSEIDAFIQNRLQQSGLKPSPQAERRRLIRRLYLVMHGLPPTPKQISDFANDSRTDAWKRLVDDVLSSPRYGERWGQHWLDLVRFGETHGFETNRERPNAWPYRDWVIRSFNTDKPYDRFIIEQIAGDAVGEDVGTGFLVAGPYDLVKGKDPDLGLMQRQDELADMINTTGTAFLGLTVGCARCHNHKFDPISQTDYYAMQAVFAGVNHAERPLPLPEEKQQQIAELDRNIAELTKQLEMFVRRPQPGMRPDVNAKKNTDTFEPIVAKFVRFTIHKTNQSQPCIDELEIYSGDENVALASAGAKPSSSGDFVHPLHKLAHINDGRHGNSRSWISSVVSGGWVQIELPEPTKIDRIVWGRDRRGRYGDRVAIDYKIEVSTDESSWKSVSSSADRMPYRRRKTKSSDYDFGAFNKPKAEQGRAWYADLLAKKKLRDELSKSGVVYAGTFSQPGPTHRLYRGEHKSPREQVSPAGIVSLSGPQLKSDAPEQQRRLTIAKWIVDNNNPLTARVMVNRLWQFHFGTGIVDTPSDFGANGTRPSHPKLLDWLATELIRSDWSLKHIHRLILTSATWKQDSQPRPEAINIDAGSRLLWRFPPRRLEAEGIRDCILAVTGKLDLEMGGPGFSAFEINMENVRHYFPKKDYGPSDWRRMVYMTKVRQERDSVFGVFDCPDGSQVTPKRSRSTTPLQALNLLNSRFVIQQAEFLTERLKTEATNDEERIRRAYQLCFGRSPDSEEMQRADDFIARTNWIQFSRAILNANEFVFIP